MLGNLRPFAAVALLWGAVLCMLCFDGGIPPSTRAIASAMIAGAALFIAGRRMAAGGEVLRSSHSRLRAKGKLRLLVYALIGYGCAQLIPLPPTLVQFISPRRNELTIAAAPFLSGHLWQSISVSPARSMLELLTLLDCALVCLCVRQVSRASRGRGWIIAPLVLAGLMEALVGLFQASNPNGPATATGTFLNRNHLAGFLEMLLPFVLVGSWIVAQNHSRRQSLRVLGTTLLLSSALLFIASVFETYSRMGMIVVLFTTVLTISLVFWSRYRLSPARLVFVLGALTALLATSLIFAPSRLLNRFEHASQMDRDSTNMRVGFWRDSVSLLADYALVGSGLGTFESVFPSYQKTGTLYRVEYLHNDFLQAAIELGLLPFLLGLAILGLLLQRFYRLVRYSSDLQTRCFAIASFSSLGGILLHSFVDFNLHIPANAVTCAWIIGVGLSLDSEFGKHKLVSRNPITG